MLSEFVGALAAAGLTVALLVFGFALVWGIPAGLLFGLASLTGQSFRHVKWAALSWPGLLLGAVAIAWDAHADDRDPCEAAPHKVLLSVIVATVDVALVGFGAGFVIVLARGAGDDSSAWALGSAFALFDFVLLLATIVVWALAALPKRDLFLLLLPFLGLCLEVPTSALDPVLAGWFTYLTLLVVAPGSWIAMTILAVRRVSPRRSGWDESGRASSGGGTLVGGGPAA